MIPVCRAIFEVCNKTVPLDGPHSKVNIKSTKDVKCLFFGTVKDKMATFVIKISHRFTFVLLPIIWLTSEI